MTMFGITRVLAGAVFGAAMMCRAATAQEGGGSGWAAWVDAEPPGPSKLIVTGTVSTPNPGYQVRLVRESVEGERLILRVDMRPSSGVWAQVIQEKEVRYEEAPYSGGYSGVLIRTGTGPDRTLAIATAR